MDGWKTLCKHYFSFHRYEVQSLAIFTVLFTLIALFRVPDGTTVLGWLVNSVIAYALILLIVIGRLSLLKVFSLSQGYTLRFKPFWEGIIVTAFFGVLSFGWLFLPLLGSFHTDFLKRQRLGKFFYGYDYHEHAIIIFMTTLVTLFVASVVRAMSLYIDWFVLDKLVYFMVILSITQLLPLPWLEGLQVFFGSRLMYTFLLIFSVAVGTLLFIPTTLTTVLAIMICGFLGVVSILWH